MQVRFIPIGSPEYDSLCDLRYRVFFQERGFPKDILFDPHEASSLYAVITAPDSRSAVACGRLTALTATEWQISQMAVAPDWQGKKLGSAILVALLNKATELGADVVCVDARTSAIGFYERFGFRVASAEFPSAKTGTPHVIMRKLMRNHQPSNSAD
jgi:predicted GNAT family N-acyltransferase